jgi:hypothetical protein
MTQEAVLPTYKAILRGNRLEWRGDAGKHIPTNRAVAVHVTVSDEPLTEADAAEKGSDRGAQMATALERLAEIHALQDIKDVAAWEREVRQDWVLPDRDG